MQYIHGRRYNYATSWYLPSLDGKVSDMLCHEQRSGRYAAKADISAIVVWYRWGSIMEQRWRLQHSFVNASGPIIDQQNGIGSTSRYSGPVNRNELAYTPAARNLHQKLGRARISGRRVHAFEKWTLPSAFPTYSL